VRKHRVCKHRATKQRCESVHCCRQKCLEGPGACPEAHMLACAGPQQQCCRTCISPPALTIILTCLKQLGLRLPAYPTLYRTLTNAMPAQQRVPARAAAPGMLSQRRARVRDPRPPNTAPRKAAEPLADMAHAQPRRPERLRRRRRAARQPRARPRPGRRRIRAGARANPPPRPPAQRPWPAAAAHSTRGP